MAAERHGDDIIIRQGDETIRLVRGNATGEDLDAELPPAIYRRVRLGDIRVPQFQRGEIRSQIQRIARRFSWSLFGAAILYRDQEDSQLYVIDGQQRLAALRTKGDHNVMVPSLLYEHISYQRAAKIYHDVNAPGNKRGLTPGDLLKAELAAGEPTALDLYNRTEDLGINIDFDLRSAQRSPVNIRAVAAMRHVYRIGGGEHYTRVLRALKEAFPEDPARFNQTLLKGMHLFLFRFGSRVTDREVIDKLRGVTTEDIARKAAAWAELSRGDRASYTGRAIHSQINSGRRGNRLPSWDIEDGPIANGEDE